MTKKNPKNTSLTKPYTDKEVFMFIDDYLLMKGDKKELVNKLGTKLLPAFKDGDTSDEMYSNISECADALMRVHESEHGGRIIE